MKISKTTLAVTFAATLISGLASGGGTESTASSERGAAVGAKAFRAPHPVHQINSEEENDRKSIPARKLESVPPAEQLAEVLAGTVPAIFYYLVVPGTNFHPRDSTVTVTYAGSGCIYTNGGQVVAQLPLPDGATVNYLRTYYRRNDAGQSSTVWLTKYAPGTATLTDVATVNATQTGALVYTDLSILLSDVVQNDIYGYVAIWQGTGAFNNTLCGVRVAYASAPTGTYTSVTPCRLIDTRSTNPPNLSTVPRDLQITGSCGIPAGATAVTANVTTADPTAGSWMAVWPQGGSYSGTSNLNFGAGEIVANSAVLQLGATGQITARVGAGTAALILDVSGYYY